MQSNIIEQVKNRVSIVDEVKTKVKLVKKGKNYVGLCPFHNEKTASFYVDPNKSFFHCFGCNASGDVIEFTIKSRNLSFNEALEYLANKIGLNISHKPVDFQKQTKIKNLYTLMEVAANWFTNNLFMPEAKNAFKYLLNRNLSKEVLKTFQIGFVPKSKDYLTNFLLKQGFEEKDIITTGLRSTGPNGNYDVFRNRIIFPIKDKLGKIIAFGGRSLIDEDKPKYLNSRDTPFFHKKLNLYALNEAIKKNQDIILVEGYIDVLSLYQSGITGAVAPLGTAVSKEQLMIISKLSSKPVICLDGDSAGINATLRVALLFLEILQPNIIPRFVTLPENYDPDSFINKYGKNKFIELIDKSKVLSEFLWDSIISQNEDINNMSPEIKSMKMSKIKEYCNLIKNDELKQNFLKFFQDKFNFYKNSYTKFLDKKNKDFLIRENLKNKVKINYNELRGYFIIAYVISCPSIYDVIDQKFALLEFENQELEKIRQTIVELLNNSEYNSNDLFQVLANNGFNTILNNIFNHEAIRLNLKRIKQKSEFIKSFDEIYSVFLLQSLKQDMMKIQNQLKHEKSPILFDKLKNLHMEINKIKMISKESV